MMKVDTISRDELVDYLEGGSVERVDLGALAVARLPDGKLAIETCTDDRVLVVEMGNA